MLLDQRDNSYVENEFLMLLMANQILEYLSETTASLFPAAYLLSPIEGYPYSGISKTAPGWGKTQSRGCFWK